jgi:hypothetical protein
MLQVIKTYKIFSPPRAYAADQKILRCLRSLDVKGERMELGRLWLLIAATCGTVLLVCYRPNTFSALA